MSDSTDTASRRYGVEKLRIYPSSLSLDIENLCRARGLNHDDVARNLMTQERSVVPPWEDTVTLAVNAVHEFLNADELATVELLIVATESSVDQEKPVSSWVHRWLGTPSHCRNVEIKHACYGGMAAIRMALAWLREQEGRPCRALVLCADSSLKALGEPFEPTQGACSAAILLSANPDFLEIEPNSWGVCAVDATNVIRPALGIEAGNDASSVYTYLETLEGAYRDYERRTDAPVDFDRRFVKHVYHLPFAGMALQAHRALAALAMGLGRRDASDHYQSKVADGLHYSRRIGSSFSASTMHALLSILDHCDDVMPGERVSVFAYGSGSCAEFYDPILGRNARARAREADVGASLDCRRPLSIAEYEASENARVGAMGAINFSPDLDLIPGWYEEFYEGSGLLVLDRIDNYERIYRRA